MNLPVCSLLPTQVVNPVFDEPAVIGQQVLTARITWPLVT
jgi:hypothetical protein